MAVLENLQNILPELSKNERKAAEYLLHYPHDIHRWSSEAIAREAGTSRSAIIRLCQKMGYQGFAEFKYACTHEPVQSIAADSHTALLHYSHAIQEIQNMVMVQQIEALGHTIVNSRRVISLGHLHSGMSAQQMAFRLTRSGVDSMALIDGTLMEHYESIVSEGDVVLIFSLSGAEMYEDIAVRYRKHHAHVVLITMTPTSPLTKLVDEVIVLPYVSHEPSSYLMDDAITFFLLIEQVIEAVQKELSARQYPES